MSSQIPLHGQFRIDHIRDGKVLASYGFPNGMTIEGKNKLLDVMFHGAAQVATWYLGLIDNAGYSALAEADTYAGIDQAGNGWDEFKNYSQANRVEWAEGAASGKSVTNASPAVFDITGAGTVKGLFLVGGDEAATIGDHTAGNFLWSTAAFSSGDVVVANGDQLKATYTVSA